MKNMKLKFTKMHGAGNDFVVIDGINQSIHFSSKQWQAIADRRFGVGADQILLVQASEKADVDFRYHIFNADGSEVEQCGNGARAFVRFVVDKGLTNKTAIRVETMSGIIEPSIEADGNIRVNMGKPRFAPELLAFQTQELLSVLEGQDQLWPIEIDNKQCLVSLVSMGNPHAVQIVDDVDTYPVLIEGALLERHPRFLQRVNAGFMQIVNPHHIRLRVFERGSGETLACGTGACAAVVAGIRRGHLVSPVKVDTKGGQLSIAWVGEEHSVLLSGPAVSVFEGEMEIAE
jgi:diaminopimelate epimerase